jgi:hypothetical protein
MLKSRKVWCYDFEACTVYDTIAYKLGFHLDNHTIASFGYSIINGFMLI